MHSYITVSESGIPVWMAPGYPLPSFSRLQSRSFVLCRLAWGFFQTLSSCLQSSSPGHWRTERVVVLLAVGCGPPLGLETPQCSCYVLLSHTSLSLLLKWRLTKCNGILGMTSHHLWPLPLGKSKSRVPQHPKGDYMKVWPPQGRKSLGAPACPYRCA